MQTAQYLTDLLTGSPEETEACLNWLSIRAKNLVSAPEWWPAVEALAVALPEKRTLGPSNHVRSSRQVSWHWAAGGAQPIEARERYPWAELGGGLSDQATATAGKPARRPVK